MAAAPGAAATHRVGVTACTHQGKAAGCMSVIPDAGAGLAGEDDHMRRSHTTQPIGDLPLFLLFTLAHAAVAFPTLRMWAGWCERQKR